MCVALSNWPIHSLWEENVLCQVPLQQGWIQDFTYSEGSFEGPRGPTSACAGALLPSFTEQQNIFPVFHIGSLKQLFLLNNTAAYQPTALLLQLQNTPETYLNQDRQRHLYCWMTNVPCLNLSPSLVSETSPIMSSVVFFLPWVFIFLAKCICSSVLSSLCLICPILYQDNPSQFYDFKFIYKCLLKNILFKIPNVSSPSYYITAFGYPTDSVNPLCPRWSPGSSP